MTDKLKFSFRASTKLKFGAGESSNLGEELGQIGFQTIAVIIDAGIKSHVQLKSALQSLSSANVNYELFFSDAVEPDYDYLDHFKLNFVDKQFDAIVGIGGGSTLDLAKAMATIITNPGPAINHRGFPELENRPLPVVAIPTTAGTGSEVTFNAVFTDSKSKKKLGINSEHNFPVLSIIDPLFTVGCPQSVTVSAGCDALVHTLESYVHRNHTLISRMYSKEAFKLVFNSLAKVLKNPEDVEVRARLALGAYLAGIALINAGSGPSGAFSYPLGAVYKVPHGYAGAVFISSITQLNVEKGYLDYAELYDMIDGAKTGLSQKEKNIEFVHEMKKLMETLGVPKSLSKYNLGQEDIYFMIEQFDVLKKAIEQNPIEVTKEDVKKIMLELA